MYEKLSKIEIENFQKTNTTPIKDNLTLKDLIVFYENDIMPYRYIYECEHNLKVSFTFEEENLPHLLFGTIEKTYAKRKDYTGQLGYDNMKNGLVTLDNLPKFIYDKGIHRILNFILISKVLAKPSVIIFNKNLVKQNGNKYINTNINAKFLLDRNLNNGKHIHLFLDQVGKSKRLVPNSFFPNDKENYILDQVSFKVENSKIEKIKDDSSKEAI